MTPAPARLVAIDLLRGLAIAEMMIAHFARYVPAPLPTLIAYTETAMALFVLLAGFMTGWRIVEFTAAPLAQSRNLVLRAGKILVVQAVLVLTAGIAMFEAGLAGTPADLSLFRYVVQSLLLENQVGLIHILPTFIPLFLIAPAVLFALSRERAAALVAVSVAVFVAGHFNPQILSYGTPPIFPFVLFQLYFVAGCCAGCWSRRNGLIGAGLARRWLPWAVAALCLTMLGTHLKVVPAGTIQTHPLNLYGLIYHAPLIATVLLAGLAFESRWRGHFGTAVLTRFGRHSLLAFVLHLYCAVALLITNHWHPLPLPVNLAAIVCSVAFMNWALMHYEEGRNRVAPTGIVRSTRALLG